MENDFVDYRDPQGWMTRDYTMSPSDVARMQATGSVLKQPYDNYAANGWQKDGSGNYVPPGVASMGPVPNVARPAAARPAGTPPPANVTSQPMSATMPPMTPGDAANLASIRQGTATSLAVNLLDTSSPEAYAASQRMRAGLGVGGANLYQTLNNDHVFDPQPLSPSSLLSGLTDPDGKPIPGNQIDSRIVSHPAFQQMEALDKVNGTNNAAQFYYNVKGRTLDGDRAANSALLATQSSNKLKDANTLQGSLTVAPADDKDKGIYKNDLVKQVILPGMLPGTNTVQYVPLTPYERELANVTPDKNTDGTQKMDQYGRPQVSPKGNSFLHQATGLPSAADLQWRQNIDDQAARDKAAANPRNNVTSQPAPTKPGDIDTTRQVYQNATTTLSNTVNHMTDMFTGTHTPDAPYTPVGPMSPIVAPVSTYRPPGTATMSTAPGVAAMYAASHASQKRVPDDLLLNDNYDPRLAAILASKFGQ